MRKVRGPEHRDTALAINNLAALLRDKGDWPAAERLMGESLAIRRAALGGDHVEAAPALLNLGSLLDNYEDIGGAEQLYREALAIFEHAVGRKHPHTAQTLSTGNSHMVHLESPQTGESGGSPWRKRCPVACDRSSGAEVEVPKARLMLQTADWYE